MLGRNTVHMSELPLDVSLQVYHAVRKSFSTPLAISAMYQAVSSRTFVCIEFIMRSVVSFLVFSDMRPYVRSFISIHIATPYYHASLRQLPPPPFTLMYAC